MSSQTDTILRSLDTDLIFLSPVEWAEQNRILTSDITNWPGKMSYARTPYLKEIANSIMPSSDGQIFAIMKGSQIGFSIGGIFTMMGWIIKESPSNMLFIVNDDEGVKRAMQGPIDQMIVGSGLSSYIRASNVRAGRNQKTGDTAKGKQFPNGNLFTWSGQSIGKLSQISVKYGFYDEFERYPVSDKRAGSLVSLIEERHKSYADTRKLYFISTPEIKQTSNIEPLYLDGDQRKYHLPCKHCGEFISIEWQIDIDHLEGKAGVCFDRKSNGELIKESVRYVCQSCGESFKQSHLYDCYEDDLCKWIPTATPISPIYRSYHISALYAPHGMYNWQHYAQKWCEIHKQGRPSDLEKLKTFLNQCLGQTWEVKGSEIEIKHLMKNTRNYDIGVAPNVLSIQDGNGPIIMLTCAVDLNGKEDDARLDYEVLAWSKSGSSYSINHGSIGTFQRSKTVRSGQAKKYAKQDEDRVKWTYRHNYPNNVWSVYEKEIMTKIFPSDDQKRKFRIAFHGIDTGHFTHHAYEFVTKHGNVIGLKGKVDNKYTKHDADKSFFKKSTTQDKLYLVEGDRIKNDLHGEIQLVWSEDMDIDQPEGFMNFPNPDGEKYMIKSYFSHFEGEKMEAEMNQAGTAIGFRWVKQHSSSVNHLFDCRVYNIALKHVFTSMVCKAAKVPVSWVNFMALFGK